jgi:hypothetical protein
MLGVALALVGVGCGGRVIDEGSPPAGSPTGTSRLPDGGRAGAGGSPSGSVILQVCHPGFLAADLPARPCNFLFVDRCYDTKDAACACACPNRSGTQCVSGFPEPNGRVAVTCG